MGLVAWIWRIAGPLLLVGLARRLAYGNALPPPHDARLPAAAAALLARPGDVLVCKGGSVDSCSVAAWSKSVWTHVAVVGPDLHVYDMTPGENERRMLLWDYVRAYEGWVCWRPRDPAAPPPAWSPAGSRSFRDAVVPMLLAACVHRPAWRRLVQRHGDGLVRLHARETDRAFCSEYVAQVLSLPDPLLTHPADFAEGGHLDRGLRTVLLWT